MCVACAAAIERLEAANALQQVCQQKYGMKPALRKVFRPVDDHAFDALLARLDGK